MDWKLFGITFATVFLAELGDKTQIATLTFAATEQKPWTVLLGAALALVCTSAAGVLAGTLLGHAASGPWIKRAAGVLFVVMGVLYLIGRA
ncbi:MAG: TMEM165/GDT1 family protein [Acidobacteriota bacterium]